MSILSRAVHLIITIVVIGLGVFSLPGSATIPTILKTLVVGYLAFREVCLFLIVEQVNNGTLVRKD